MAGQSIAQFWADLGVRVDAKETRKIDATLKSIERRFLNFKRQLEKQGALSIEIAKFKVDQKGLVLKLGDALDKASKKVRFEISNFVVDEEKLAQRLQSSVNRATNKVTAPEPRQPRAPRERYTRRESERNLRTGLGAGIGAAGGLSLGRVYPAILAAAGGAYGLSELNQRNQQIQSANLTTQAVVQQAGGTEQQGQQASRWLRAQADRVGFNWLEASNDYNNVISGITGAGGTVAQGQNIFKGFSEYGRVNHIDTERQKRVFRALSQIAGKDKLMSEELTGQLAESLPGAVSLFAEAYQRQTGGNLTGSDATTALLAAMKKGQVRGNILNPAAQIASERAAPTLAHSSRTSQSEQARYENNINRLVSIANQSGVESGYARLFRTLNNGLENADDLVTRLSSGFDEVTKKLRVLTLLPTDFKNALEGKSSFIADLIGKDSVDSINSSLKSIKDSWEELKKSFGETSWGDYLKSTLKEVQMILGEFARIAAASAGAKRYEKYLIENGTSPAVAQIQAAGKFLGTSRKDTDDIPAYEKEQQAKYPFRSELDLKYLPQDQKSQVNGDVPISPTIPNIPVFDPIDPQGRVNGIIQRNTDAVAAQNQVQQDVERNTTNNNDNRVNVTLGDITIQTSATDAQGIANDFGQHVRDLMGNILSETRIQYPSIGR